MTYGPNTYAVNLTPMPNLTPVPPPDETQL